MEKIGLLIVSTAFDVFLFGGTAWLVLEKNWNGAWFIVSFLLACSHWEGVKKLYGMNKP